MYLVYCFLAFLSLCLFNASKNVGEERGDLLMIHSHSSSTILFFIIGALMPFVTMFFYLHWYWAILMNIGLILCSMIVANFFTKNSSAIPSLVIGIISVILFSILLLK